MRPFEGDPVGGTPATALLHGWARDWAEAVREGMPMGRVERKAWRRDSAGRRPTARGCAYLGIKEPARGTRVPLAIRRGTSAGGAKLQRASFNPRSAFGGKAPAPTRNVPKEVD
jgi:hypothetical protein